MDSADQSFRIGGLTIDYSVAELDGVSLANGSLVEVKDTSKAYTPGLFSIVATKVEPAGLLMSGGEPEGGNDASDLGQIQIEGLVSNIVNANQFELAGILVNHDASTTFVYGDRTQLAAGTKVQAEGVLDESGAITAQQIKFANNSTRVHGIVELVDRDAELISILGVDIDLASVVNFEDKRDDVEPFALADVLSGDFLEVRGSFFGTTVIANEVVREEDDDTRLRGPSDNVNAEERSLTILGVEILTSASTQFEGLNDEVLSAEEFFGRLANGQTLVDAQWESVVVDSSLPVRELSLED